MPALFTFANRAIQVIRLLGPRWALYRAGYSLSRKAGLLKRRFPTKAWAGVSLADLVRAGVPSSPDEYRGNRERAGATFFFPAGQLPNRELLRGVVGGAGRDRALAVADDYRAGRFLCFGRHTRPLGWPVDWLVNPFTGARHHARSHWVDYPTFSPRLGDIKDVWEASRFGCAYWLARAYALTGDEKYPGAFWEMFESWVAANPPNMGPNWKCGQETAIRVFAWCFALYAFWNSPATTGDRVCAMVRMLAIQADRIEKNIDYAISQKNNHSMSEAVGLMTVGLLFPELRDSSRWLDLGTSVLESDVRRQVYDDGSFVQHSMNYHRVMLHDCMWALRLAELNGRPLADDVRDRIRRAAEFLLELMDDATGRVPNHGSNDGATVLPLSACDYTDYRATTQAAWYLTHGSRPLPAGPWDEMLLWLAGADALPGECSRRQAQSSRFDAGGYYTLRRGDAWCMARCHTYRDRPAHVDMLHVDLWHKGVNVLSDSGSYKYFTPEARGLDRYFKDIAAHNTIEIDGRGPLAMASRFLWVPWPSGRCLEHNQRRWIGEHDAYDRAPWRVKHKRTVEAGDALHWTITDELSGEGEHAVVLRWHICDGECSRLEGQTAVTLQTRMGEVALAVDGPPDFTLTILRGRQDAAGFSGWDSRYYREKSPRPTIEVRGRSRMPLRLVTRVSLPA